MICKGCPNRALQKNVFKRSQIDGKHCQFREMSTRGPTNLPLNSKKSIELIKVKMKKTKKKLEDFVGFSLAHGP